MCVYIDEIFVGNKTLYCRINYIRFSAVNYLILQEVFNPKKNQVYERKNRSNKRVNVPHSVDLYLAVMNRRECKLRDKSCLLWMALRGRDTKHTIVNANLSSPLFFHLRCIEDDLRISHWTYSDFFLQILRLIFVNGDGYV